MNTKTVTMMSNWLVGNDLLAVESSVKGEYYVFATNVGSLFFFKESIDGNLPYFVNVISESSLYDV